MKNLFYFITLAFLLTSCGGYQSASSDNENDNFEIVNDMVFWRYVYDESMDIDKLKQNPKLDFETDTTGFIIRTNFNDKQLKDLTGEFKIQSKGDRYRVSVFNVVFYTEPMTLNSGGLGMQTISEHTIEESLIKDNGQMRKSFWGYNLTAILNPHLINLFKAIKLSLG